MNKQKDSNSGRGKLNVEVDFPIGTSRHSLMELLADALYKSDVNLFDPMPVENKDWETIESTGISFRYCSDVPKDEKIEGSLGYEKLKSLYLHEAVLDELRKDRDRVVSITLKNIEKWKEIHRLDGMSVKYLDEWTKVLDKGSMSVQRVLLGVDDYSCDLRQNSPFAGVLSEEQRLNILKEFKEYWTNNFEEK